MATIQEKIKDGKIISCKFKACVGRDENKKQIFRCMTWYPSDDMTLAKSRKAAKQAADVWEQETKQAYLTECENEKQDNTSTAAETIQYTFDGFVNDVWIPLFLRDGSHRPNTIAFYNGFLKVILSYFKGIPLNAITSMKINEYFVWLRSEYRTIQGKPLSDTSIKHSHRTLKMIFKYAESQEIIIKNPMKKVAVPKATRKPVDALSKHEAEGFFKALSNCTLDFRCMLHILITTGLRRGECIGLQWRDIDFENGIVHVERAVTYTPESGIIVDAPKTDNSIRTIPLMISTINLLKEWRQEIERIYPNTNLDCAFLLRPPKILCKSE